MENPETADPFCGIRISRHAKSPLPLPADVDEECVELCEAINALPGLETFESCCGHGEHEFRIWLSAGTVDDLLPLAQACRRDSSGVHGWSVVAVAAFDTTEPARERVFFCLTGPAGDYANANEIAEYISDETDYEEKATA